MRPLENWVYKDPGLHQVGRQSLGYRKMTAITLVLLAVVLTAREFAYGQQWQDIYITEAREGMAVFKKKQNEILEVLKGYGDLQQKQNDILAKLSEMQKKLGYVENNIEGLHRDLELVKDFHHELEHVKGAVNSNQDSLQNISAKLEPLEEIQQETKGCLGREDLEHFKNKSSAGQQELESLLRQEISGVISLLETWGIDECSEGSHNCTDYEACANKLFKYQCSCLPGFARDGSRCEDIDECTQGKDDCSPLATCKNSVGSYSCSCNPPFEGDGRTCEFPCKSPAKVFKDLGCVKIVEEFKTFEEIKVTCHEAGGHLLQDFTHTSLQEVGGAFPYHGWTGWILWIGAYENKWLKSGLPLKEELWAKGSGGLNPSRRLGHCGAAVWDLSSSSVKVSQIDCSERFYGACQFVTPQK